MSNQRYNAEILNKMGLIGPKFGSKVYIYCYFTSYFEIFIAHIS